MRRRRLTLVAGLALAITASLVTTSLAQKGDLSVESARINALRSAGRYSEALPLAQAMVASLEKTANNRDLSGALNNLAQIHADQGRDDQAEPLYKRAIALMEKGMGLDSVEIAPVLNNLAALDQRQSRFAEAEPLFKRALAIREKALSREHPDVGQSLNNLGTLYVKQQRYADAEPLLQRALAIYQKIGGPEHPAVATLLNNLGQLYRDLNRDADAEAPIKRSLAIREKVLGLDHPDVARSLNNLAGLYEHQQRYADAEPLYRRALAIRERALGPDHPDVATSTSNLAYFLYASGRNAEALPLAEKTLRNDRAQLRVVLPVLFAARQQSLLPDDKALDEALTAIQRGTQSSAASAVNKLAVRLAAGSDRLAELVRRDQDLAAESEALDKAIIAAVAKPSPQRDVAAEQRSRARIAAIVGERAGLQKTLAIEFPDYASLSNPLPLAVKDIQPLLSADEAMVLYAVVDQRSYVIAITREGVDLKEISLGTDALTQKVTAFRRGLDVGKARDASGKSGLFDLALANELYVALLSPVEALTRDKRNLLVVPSAALTALPFHLLVTEKPQAAVPDTLEGYRSAAWLLRRQAVSVLPSVVSLKSLRGFTRKDEGVKPMTGFGDPVFNPALEGPAERRAANGQVAARSVVTSAYSEFWRGAGVDRARLAQSLPQLPDTADELNAVAKDVGAAAADIHLGRDASEATLKRAALPQYRIIYFATHGLVAGDIKGLGEPSLALSIPEQPTELDDGLLTASEVAQLKLNADWVVLSACNTIAGDKPGAEALSGLARAFFYAGARALLVSHWAVDSEAATRLTTSTFDLLKNEPGLGRAEALRRAMLTYVDDASSPRNAYPAMWGPFALIGEGEVR
ncbi:CHAT domain-containing protein [Bradyrhizobium diazoefficiens]|nr:CHAT domain-containing tetratricopeptide repeat protein [Bradyrhizobium diazoefficiens]UCF51628.1 MAG: CHAT domain-containing protein [Bradyrhizobium sp.]MBR0966353.1 CHAT domain-containing protein [Bradyrhizobium diazoefficiens]MBR0979823.1 CHAT domain-containing protein [Bradyrhizobium diazoefficiens]MBR1009171.1 CHAT domain-containing protein [Bradyrhizobium diazoefficiens]MBR1012448.1 CHAT domain-containing protein [Bradyrhizobium diazoefficiens]